MMFSPLDKTATMPCYTAADKKLVDNDVEVEEEQRVEQKKAATIATLPVVLVKFEFEFAFQFSYWIKYRTFCSSRTRKMPGPTHKIR
jgi:hypothetical protein